MNCFCAAGSPGWNCLGVVATRSPRMNSPVEFTMLRTTMRMAIQVR